jgi:hypothetical protein
MEGMIFAFIVEPKRAAAASLIGDHQVLSLSQKEQ